MNWPSLALLVVLTGCLPELTPPAPIVAIEPASPGPDDGLVAVIDVPSADPGGTPVTISTTWTVDGVTVASVDGTRIPADRTEPGQHWIVFAVVSIGEQVSATGSADAVIGGGLGDDDTADDDSTGADDDDSGDDDTTPGDDDSGDDGLDLDDDGDGVTENQGDCDDTDATTFTGNPEVCDGQDNDCLDGADFAGEDLDQDGDGAFACADCADQDATRRPGSVESCDDIDSNCDGSLVDGFGDLDGDFYPDCVDVDADGDGTDAIADCDDLDPLSTTVPQDGTCDGIVDPPLVRAQAGIEFVLVPAGSFTMGCMLGRDDVAGGCLAEELPSHTVTVTRATWSMVMETSQAQWLTVMGYAPSYFTACGPDCPVERVSWHEAAAFANAVSQVQGLPDCYVCSGLGSGVNCTPSGVDPATCIGFRLPTEAEYEWLARSGGGFPYAGGSNADDVAWWSGNSGAMTHAGGTRTGTASGLHDVSGNVAEWTGDGWMGAANYPASATFDPFAPPDAQVAVRGGGFGYSMVSTRAAYRDLTNPGDRRPYIGFRVVRSVPTDDSDLDGVIDVSDCDFADPSIYPDAPEFCDFIDSDCNGSLADAFPDLDGDTQPDCVDTDSDGDGIEAALDCSDLDANSTLISEDGDCDGTVSTEDCDDSDPYSSTVLDDQNCDGLPDPGFVELQQGIDFAFVPAGTFTMGCVGSRDNVAGGCTATESPAHSVTLTRALWVMTTETTNSMWSAHMAYSPQTTPTCGSGNCPVGTVSWHEVVAFSNALSASEGLPYCYSCTGSGATVTCSPLGSPYDCSGYRLPTEAEWEYAARGGENFPYAGSVTLADVGWYTDNSGGQMHSVAEKPPNGFGLYDLSGNTWEWCHDSWGGAANYVATAATDPWSASGFYNVRRGGAFSIAETNSRLSNRNMFDPADRNGGLGFRLVRSVP